MPKAATVAPHRKYSALLIIVLVIRSTYYGLAPHCVTHSKAQKTDVCEEIEVLFWCITQLRLHDNTKISIGFGFVLSQTKPSDYSMW